MKFGYYLALLSPPPVAVAELWTLGHICTMKLSRPFLGVVIGAAIFLVGICMAYIQIPNYYILNYFPGLWRSRWYWSQVPISLIALCLGIAIIFISLIAGFVSGLIAHLRRR